MDPQLSPLQSGLQQFPDVGGRGQPAARGRMPRAHSPGHRAIPQSLHPSTYRCGLPALARADGLSRLVRGVRGRPLVHLRCNTGPSTWRASCRRLWARCRRRGDVQPVWPGAISQGNGCGGRDARYSSGEQLRSRRGRRCRLKQPWPLLPPPAPSRSTSPMGIH